MPGPIAKTVERYRIPAAAVWAIIVTPVVLGPAFAALLLFPATREEIKLLLRGEHTPVEWITFFALFGGGLIGLVLAWKIHEYGAPLVESLFFGVFATGLCIVAMEEVSWGQWLWGFETPPILRLVNQQEETTLHNLPGMHGRSALMRLAFGVGGLLGLGVRRVPPLAPLAVPGVLATWMLVTAVLGGIDLGIDFVEMDRYTYRALGVYMSEVTEMIIGIGGALYFWLKARELRFERFEPDRR